MILNESIYLDVLVYFKKKTKNKDQSKKTLLLGMGIYGSDKHRNFE